MMRYNAVAVAFIVLVILAAHAAALAPYSWRDNTISELGAQGYERAWIMRAGFAGFGAVSIVEAVQRARGRQSLWVREIPVVAYGLGILLSGIFSTSPFIPGAAYSESEARLHSVLATGAGVALSLAVVLYMLTEDAVRRKIVHLVALVLIVGVSALFGTATAGAGIAQRVLYAVGFAWLIYAEASPRARTGRLVAQR